MNPCTGIERRPHALLSFIKNYPKSHIIGPKNLLKFPFVNSTLLSINNTKNISGIKQTFIWFLTSGLFSFETDVQSFDIRITV